MLDGLGLKFQRVAAVDGRNFDVWRHSNIVKTALYYDLKLPTRGTVACFLSHRLVWAEMIKRKLKQAIVFEDDVIPTQFDPAILNINLAEFGLEQLRLEQWEVWNGKAHMACKEFVIPLLGRQAVGTPTAGTGCYIVTLAGAEKLYRAKEFWFTVDHFDVWERLYGLKTAVLRPAMFTQADAISDIDTRTSLPNELLPKVLKELLQTPRPTLREAADRLLRWVKGAGVDVLQFVGSFLARPAKKALLIYEAFKAEWQHRYLATLPYERIESLLTRSAPTTNCSVHDSTADESLPGPHPHAP